MTTQTYSIVGLGKLGASMAAAIASRGANVIGVDVNESFLRLVNEGRAPVVETGLDELMSANRDRIRATSSYAEAIHASDVTFVIVPTPSDEQGAFSLRYASQAFREIGRALATKIGYHLVVLTSTVLPGATRYGLLPLLERESGKRCGQDFGLCYSPEFIALGSVIHDFLNPDFTLVGEYDELSGSTLEAVYRRIMTNDAPCRRMSLENAELTKIAINTYVTTKITYANMLADLCERIPGGDVDVVSDAVGTDSRIGRRYLTGGSGYGGPCFPRDNVALSFMARALGSCADLAETTDAVNRALPGRMLKRLGGLIGPDNTVAVLGLAYKPLSPVIEESYAIALARAFAATGAKVLGFDPLAGGAARAELGDAVKIVDSVAACLEHADVVVIATNDPAFRTLSAPDILGEKPSVTVVDCWRLLEDALDGQQGVTYIAVGRSVDDTANAASLMALWRDPALAAVNGHLDRVSGAGRIDTFQKRSETAV